MSGHSDRIIRFAEFAMDLDALQLERNGVRIPLQIQPFRVLAILVERAGEVITREELQTALWPSKVFVDFNHGLNNAVARLREALSDSAEEPRFIETLPRIGYRFIYQPEQSPHKPGVDSAASVSVGEPPTSTGSEVANGKLAGSVKPWAIARSRAWQILTATGLFVFVAFALTEIGQFDALDSADPTIRSIAVLPFRNLSADPEQEYFAAGMTDALVTALAQNESLRVVSRRSGTRYKDTDISIARIAHDLQVDGVIDSAIIRQGDDIRVDIQLVRASDDSHVWARSYERKLQDLFILQRDLAKDITNELVAGLSSGSRHSGTLVLTENVAAYELYLQGRHLVAQRSPESVKKSLEFYRKAIELDPSFAAAYAGIAQAYVNIGGSTLVKSMNGEDVRIEALAAARRALELDDRLANAHAAMGAVLDRLFPTNAKTDAEIEKYYLTALALTPTYAAGVRHSYGQFLSRRHRNQEAIAQFREALLADPMRINTMSRLGMEMLDIGDVEGGMQVLRKAVELEPWQFNVQLRLGWACAALEQYTEANRAFAVAEQVSPGNPHALAGHAYVAARSGDTTTASAILVDLCARRQRR